MERKCITCQATAETVREAQGWVKLTVELADVSGARVDFLPFDVCSRCVGKKTVRAVVLAATNAP